MSHAIRRPRKTIEDYLPDDVRAELIDGELYVTPAPTLHHQRILLRLARTLDDWFRRVTDGEAFPAPVDVHLPSGDIVQPDVTAVRGDRKRFLHADGVHGLPDLAVEILSPARPERDRFVKRHLYARNGVPEYWLVDPEEETVEILHHRDGAYEAAGFFHGDQVLVSSSLEGLRIPLEFLFEK